MSRTVLGISAFYHDSAAVLVQDGKVLAAAQEERFSRRKHDARFPIQAINYCLEETRLEVDELDAVAFYDDPVLTWDRVVKNCIQAGESSRMQFRKAVSSVLGTKVWAESIVRNALGGLGKAGHLLISQHHLSHAASAFYPSPFDHAAIIVADGVGEWATTSIGVGDQEHIDLLLEIDYPHSLGLLYSAFTYFCGFKVNDGEYKLMGLAPYGSPRYTQLILNELIDVKSDGSYRLNTDYFGYVSGLEMTNEKFASLFGGPRRLPNSKITRREMDMASSVQVVLEKVLMQMTTFARKEIGTRSLVLAGGVALNCVANGRILESGIFDDVWIQPAAGDAGGAAGAALLTSHTHFGVPRRRNPNKRDAQRGSYLGPAFSPVEVRAFLDRHQLPYQMVDDEKLRAAVIAQALTEGKIVGYFNGRMEFGPRSLGARSILGDPRDPAMQTVMNNKIKFRESFRPFAPAVLFDQIDRYFDLNRESPYMLFVTMVRPELRLPIATDVLDNDDDLIQRISQPRSDLPAVTHVDYSARVQTVHPEDKPDFYAVVKAVEEKTGYGVVLNTSMNVRDEPIACTPRDAYLCFMRTEMDLLVIEDCLLWKFEQPQNPESTYDSSQVEHEQLLEVLRLFQEMSDAGDHPQAGTHPTLNLEIDRLFSETILPFHRLLKRRGERLVPWFPDPQLSSYYIECSKDARNCLGVVKKAYKDETELAAALHKVWAEIPVPFNEMVDEHVRVASLLAAETRRDETDVSSSLYMMF